MPTTNKNIYCSNSGNPYTISVTFSESGVNIANNTSIISISGYLVGNNINWSSNYNSYLKLYWYDNKSGKRLVATSAGFASTAINVRKNISGSITVTHNDDGALSGYAILEYTAGSTSGGWAPGSNSVQNGNTALSTIARASSISGLTGSQLGSAVTVSIDRKSTSFTHKVEYSFAGSGYVTAATGVGTSSDFVVPTSTYAPRIPNSTSGILTVRLTTYNGSTQIGSSVTKTLSLSLASSITPTMSAPTATRVDNGVPAAWGVYVKGFSKATIKIPSASGIYGSTIKSYSITGTGLSTSSSSGTTSVLNSSGSLPYKCTATDSRGRSVTEYVGISIVDYTNPSLYITANRCNSTGVLSSDGTYLKVVVDYAFASVSSKNSIVSKSCTCNSVSNTTFGDGVSFILAANCSIGSKYTLTASVTDALGKTSSANILVNTAHRIMNIKANKKGVAFGKFSEKDAFEVAMPAEMTDVMSLIAPNNKGVSWINGRNAAILKTLNSNSGLWWPITSSKTLSGSWETGILNENYFLSYAKDSNYNTHTNSTNIFSFNSDGDIKTPKGEVAQLVAREGFSGIENIVGNYLRTPPAGILPYASGECGSAIGSSSWPFRSGNINNLYTNIHGLVCGGYAAIYDDTGNGWYAYRFSNGLLIQFKYVNQTWTGSAWGGVFSSDKKEETTYPISFADVPIRLVTHAGISGSNWWGAAFSTDSSVNLKTKFGWYSLIRGSNSVNFKAPVFLCAIGRFK